MVWSWEGTTWTTSKSSSLLGECGWKAVRKLRCHSGPGSRRQRCLRKCTQACPLCGRLGPAGFSQHVCCALCVCVVPGPHQPGTVSVPLQVSCGYLRPTRRATVLSRPETSFHHLLECAVPKQESIGSKGRPPVQEPSGQALVGTSGSVSLFFSHPLPHPLEKGTPLRCR